MTKDHKINRAEFPGSNALQGMAAQANTWLLIQMDEQDLTAYEALYIAHDMLNTVIRLIGREEQKLEKRRKARKARKDQANGTA